MSGNNITLKELFDKLKNKTNNSQTVQDEYEIGYVSHRKDGEYLKTPEKWIKLKGSENEYLKYDPGKYFVAKDDLPVKSINDTDGTCFIPKGEEITDIEHFAKKSAIRDVNKLQNKLERLYGIQTRVEDWTKSKGLCHISNGTELKFVELHWYDVKGYGKFEFKEKNNWE